MHRNIHTDTDYTVETNKVRKVFANTRICMGVKPHHHEWSAGPVCPQTVTIVVTSSLLTLKEIQLEHWQHHIIIKKTKKQKDLKSNTTSKKDMTKEPKDSFEFDLKLGEKMAEFTCFDCGIMTLKDSLQHPYKAAATESVPD